MVAKDADPSPVYDVVFVVEKTANLVPYFDVLMKSYVQPTLEYFNNGPPDPTDYGHDYSCTLYCVVTFNAGDIAPEPAATCTAPTTSIHELITYLQNLELVGGAGQGSSHIAEGLSTALQVFDNIKTIRYTGVTTQRHCILVCNSPPYHMGAEESNDYRGFNSEQLASMLGKRGIHFSIISPRKIPVLQKMFDAAGAGQGTYTAHPQKDYTTDPRHMVLLHGYQLQEQLHSQKGEEDKQNEVKLTGHSVHSPASSMAPSDAQFKVPSTVISSQPSIHQNTVSPSMMPPNIQAQFNPVNASIIHPSQHPSKQPQGISPQISSLLAPQPQQGVPQLSEAQAAAVRASMMPKGDITNQPYMTHPGGMSQSPMMGMGGGMAMSTQGMMTAPVAQVAMISPASMLAQQHSQQQQQQQQQQLLQQQQHQQQQMNVSTSLPMSTQSVGMPMGQQQFQTMANMTMRPPGPQQGVNPNFPSGMAVNAGPSGTTSISVVSNVGPGGTVVTTDARQSLPPPMRDRKIVWTGALEYHEKTKTAQQQRITWLLTCRISIATNEPDLSTVNWPEKLSLQLLPQNMLSELQALCRNSRQVAFHFSNTDQDALRNLHKLMGTGFAGCVHFPPQSASETRIILLLFSAKKRAFIGLIPNDQSAFVQGIKTVLTQHKQRAQPKLLNQMHLGLAQPAMSSLGLVHKQNMPQGQGAVGLDTSALTGGQAAMVTATAGPAGVGGPAQGMLSTQGPGAAPNMQLIDRNLQAAKQRELQFQQQKTQQQQQQQQQVAADQKNLTMARQQQQQQQQFIDHDMHYPGHPYMYHHAQQQQQLRQQGLAAQRMPLQSVQQPNAQLRHLLISQQQQQQQMRQQLLMQHGRAPVPQTQQGVMGPGNTAPLQAMTMAQMSGQGTQSYDDFAFTDLV